MKETIGLDIFDQISRADALCLPTNCSIDEQTGENPMGALAGAFARRWQELPSIYGRQLLVIPNVPVILGWTSKSNPELFLSLFSDDEISNWEDPCCLVAFPTMAEIGKLASLDLVLRSAKLLVELADECEWKNVFLGSPGTGCGGLSVEQVHPVLAEIFDDRFTVMRKD